MLSCDGKSHLTHVILPRLSLEGCRLVEMELRRMVVKLNHCYVKVASSCNDLVMRKKKYIIRARMGKKKSSLAIYPTLTLMMDSYILFIEKRYIFMKDSHINIMFIDIIDYLFRFMVTTNDIMDRSIIWQCIC